MNLLKKKNSNIIFILFFSTLVIAISVFLYYMNANNRQKVDLNNSIETFNYNDFQKNPLIHNNIDYTFNILMEKLEFIKEKRCDNIDQKKFNEITNFINNIISQFSENFTPEKIEKIQEVKKEIYYYYYIKEADYAISKNKNFSLAILYYDKAIKMKLNNKELYENAKNKLFSIIVEANNELLLDIDNFINDENYEEGKKYLDAHEQEITIISNYLLSNFYLKPEYKRNIDIPVDNNGICELNKKQIFIYSKIKEKKENEQNLKIQREKERKKKEGVRIGMSKQDVLDSIWGTPLKKNSTITKNVVYEQWVYQNYNYLYFENDKLVSIQTNE